MEEVGPGHHILLTPNPLKLPLSICAAPHFVAHIFQKGFQRHVAGTIQPWMSNPGNLSISNGSKAFLNIQPKWGMREKGELRISSPNALAVTSSLSDANPNPKSVCYFGPLELGLLHGLSALICLQGIKMACHWQILIFQILVATTHLAEGGFSVTFGNPWDRQTTMSYDADDQTILGIATHTPYSCQYPICRLSFETMSCFAIICPKVGFPSVLPVQQTGLSQPVWLSDSAVYNNNETAVNPIWHVFRQSQATSFSSTGKAFKQVALFWWGWNRAAAPLLKPECSVKGMGFRKHIES